MAKRRPGRPAGITGTAVALHPHDIQSVLKVARSERYASRAEVLVMLSTTLGLRATELAPIKIIDVYAIDGSVLTSINVCRSFLPGKDSARIWLTCLVYGNAWLITLRRKWVRGSIQMLHSSDHSAVGH